MAGTCRRNRRFAFAARLAVAALFFAALLPAAPSASPLTGHLLLNGGGGEARGYWERFLALAGGKDRPIVVLPTASERPEAGIEYVETLREAGATNVQSIELRTREDAGRADFLSALSGAAGIFFTGGDQSRITAAILDTEAERAIRHVYDSGGVLGGSSAGLACMSAKMLTGGGAPDRIAAGNTELARGLGFVTEAIVDQHFVARQRQNRLLSVVLENPSLLGIGVDERTTVWIRPDRTLEVVGEGQVMIFDARASAARRVVTGDRTLLAIDALVSRILVAGDRLDLATGTLLRFAR
ncbi:MAG: cyanophycinase [Thermoanaerobaculia bacterium]